MDAFNRDPTMMWFICNNRNALALVEYHHGTVPVVLDKLGASSVAIRTVPRYDLIIRRIRVDFRLGRYFFAALAFDFHVCVLSISFVLSVTPILSAYLEQACHSLAFAVYALYR